MTFDDEDFQKKNKNMGGTLAPNIKAQQLLAYYFQPLSHFGLVANARDIDGTNGDVANHQ